MDLARHRRLGPLETVALVLTLLLLLAHAWAYRFQCDDAFISFRYARNLAGGHGLVFNPGFERVEGYTNFLWVVFLAALARLGIAPERAAPPLSLLATVALWALMIGFAWRRQPEPRWRVVVPVLLLAATRSVAVWSTSGLETRAYEAFVLAGVLRLVVEVERLGEGGRPPRPLAGWLFALATLLRPDGVIVSAAALAAAAGLLAARRSLTRRWLLGTVLPYVVITGGHYVFRYLYYGQWLPNTYYAKVGGRTWWDAGAAYLSAFALEYAVYLWVPVLVAAVAWHLRRGTAHVPALFAAAALPHALYVTAVGGDHFEYRPLDLCFPFAFLLLGDGIGVIARSRWRAAGAWACVALLLVGLWTLPWQSHRQFSERPHAGAEPGEPAAPERLDSRRAAFLRWPVLRAIASTHQRLVDHLASHGVAVRQEAHRQFVERAMAEANRLRKLSDEGLLPRDVRIAISYVGVIPYVVDVFTLDRYGLTDVHVAHSPVAFKGIMAHEKYATIAYARARGVDLWALDPLQLVVPITSKGLLAAMREPGPGGLPIYAADVGGGDYLLCQLPQGPQSAARRLPRARFQDVRDPAFIGTYIERATAAYEDLLRREPENLNHWRRFAFLMMVQQRFPSALALYGRLTEALPDDADAWENLALCQENLGDVGAAITSLERARSIAGRSADAPSEGRLFEKLARLRAVPRGSGPRAP